MSLFTRPFARRVPTAARLFVAAVAVLGFARNAPAAAAPEVVASVAPVHSLVAGVMEGVAAPRLLLPPGASPHAYALKPSDARALADADVVFRVGAGLEGFLDRPLASLAGQARVVDLAETPGLHLRESRAEADEDEEGHHDDDHAGTIDPHIWLDPVNARHWVGRIAEVLSQADPERAATYGANAQKLRERLGALTAELESLLRPVRGRPFIVFHDAYGYLEERFGLNAIGWVAVDPERQPGIRHVAALKDKIRALGAVCVFAEPQFEPKLLQTLTAGTGARTATLDPLGVGLEPGPDLYFRLMRALARDLADCLGG